MTRKSAADKVLEVLRDVGEPLATGEIVDELSEAYAESTIRNAVSKLSARGKLEKEGHGVYDIASDSAQTDTDVSLQEVPEIETGAGNDVVEPVNGGLRLPKHWIRQNYGVAPERLCVMRVRGDSMQDTLQPGQLLMAARWEGEDLQDGVIYGLRSDLGLTVKRLRFGRQDGERVIWVWSDNPEYSDHRHYLTLPEFEDEYDVVAKALEVGQKL